MGAEDRLLWTAELNVQEPMLAWTTVIESRCAYAAVQASSEFVHSFFRARELSKLNVLVGRRIFHHRTSFEAGMSICTHSIVQDEFERDSTITAFTVVAAQFTAGSYVL